MQDALYNYILSLGDSSMILGHRLSELCGHGPNLETDIALTNISLDLFGQVRSYFQYAAKVKGGDATEDSIAMLRNERGYRNVALVEQENVDFAHVIVRQFLYDAYHLPLLQQLKDSKDEMLAAIAAKSIKEVSYHIRFSSEWVKRLGDGTQESHDRMQAALDHLYPFIGELVVPTDFETEMHAAGVGADLAKIKVEFDHTVSRVLSAATLTIPETKFRNVQGKEGMHTEKLGYILSDLQYMQRAYPNMEW